jgi:hypothetical protein
MSDAELFAQAWRAREQRDNCLLILTRPQPESGRTSGAAGHHISFRLSGQTRGSRTLDRLLPLFGSPGPEIMPRRRCSCAPLQELLGHADPRMTACYAHEVDRDEEESRAVHPARIERPRLHREAWAIFIKWEGRRRGRRDLQMHR